MPFDISGNFTRAYNFQQERDNGTKILASHMDGEFDNFASAMNQVFFRNGLVAMTGDLNMSLNNIIGLASGTVNTPAIRFNADLASGLYLAGAGQVAISAAGQLSAQFGAGRVTSGILGNDTNAYNTILDNGNTVVHNFDDSDYIAYIRSSNAFSFVVGGDTKLKLDSNAVFKGNLYSQGVVATSGVNGNAQLTPGDLTHSGYVGFYAPNSGARIGYVGYASPGGAITYGNDQGNGHIFQGGGINAVNGLQVNGQNVWHAGNFNPASYMGAKVETWNLSTDGRNRFYFANNGPTYFGSPSEWNWQRASDSLGVANLSNSGVFNAVGGLQVNGQNVWHTGNLNPAAIGGNPNFNEVNVTRLYANSNADGQAIRVGDDAWLGDVNLVNGLSIRGNQDARAGFLTFGTSGIALGCNAADGTLRYGGQPVWHGGNFNPASKQDALGYTPANRAEFSYGANGNGRWRRTPDGVIEQWGVYYGPVGEGQYAFDFPIPFADANSIHVDAIPQINDYGSGRDCWMQRLGDPSTTGAIMVVQASTGGATIDGFRWHAVGN